jgi:hypothetical protein
MCRLMAERLMPSTLSARKTAAFDDGFEQAQQADIKIADLGEGFFCSSVEFLKLKVRNS